MVPKVFTFSFGIGAGGKKDTVNDKEGEKSGKVVNADKDKKKGKEKAKYKPKDSEINDPDSEYFVFPVGAPETWSLQLKVSFALFTLFTAREQALRFVRFLHLNATASGYVSPVDIIKSQMESNLASILLTGWHYLFWWDEGVKPLPLVTSLCRAFSPFYKTMYRAIVFVENNWDRLYLPLNSQDAWSDRYNTSFDPRLLDPNHDRRHGPHADLGPYEVVERENEIPVPEGVGNGLTESPEWRLASDGWDFELEEGDKEVGTKHALARGLRYRHATGTIVFYNFPPVVTRAMQRQISRARNLRKAPAIPAQPQPDPISAKDHATVILEEILSHVKQIDATQNAHHHPGPSLTADLGGSSPDVVQSGQMDATTVSSRGSVMDLLRTDVAKILELFQSSSRSTSAPTSEQTSTDILQELRRDLNSLVNSAAEKAVAKERPDEGNLGVVCASMKGLLEQCLTQLQEMAGGGERVMGKGKGKEAGSASPAKADMYRCASCSVVGVLQIRHLNEQDSQASGFGPCCRCCSVGPLGTPAAPSGRKRSHTESNPDDQDTHGTPTKKSRTARETSYLDHTASTKAKVKTPAKDKKAAPKAKAPSRGSARLQAQAEAEAQGSGGSGSQARS